MPGYNFDSLAGVSPFLEPTSSGFSASWARRTALQHNCTVLVGYPERNNPAGKPPTGPEYYNAAVVVNRDGDTVANYRKSHLYYTDETWALEGPDGFYQGQFPRLGHVAIGICMDLKYAPLSFPSSIPTAPATPIDVLLPVTLGDAKMLERRGEKEDGLCAG